MIKNMEIKKLKFIYMDILDVNIELKQNYTVLNGDSGTGKTYLYEIINQYASENNRKDIICINLDNVNSENIEFIINKIKNSKNSIIFVDQADSLFMRAEELKDYISRDRNNYYIIVSKTFARLYTEWAKPVITEDSVSIRYKIETFC